MEILKGKKGLASGSCDWTLDDYVMELFQQRKVGSPEFETIIRIYGKERVASIFEKWVMLKEEKKREARSDGQ